MEKKIFSRDFYYREMEDSDSLQLQSFAQSCLKTSKAIPSILGCSTHENRDLAKAYSTNKELYPFAYIIYDKENATNETPIGCLVAQLSGEVLDVSIVMTGELAHLKTLVVLSDFTRFTMNDYGLSFDTHDKRALEILNSLVCFEHSEEENEEVAEEAYQKNNDILSMLYETFCSLDYHF